MRLNRALAAAALTLGLLTTGSPAAQAENNSPDFDWSNCQFTNGKLDATELAVGTTHERNVEAHVRATGCGEFTVNRTGVSGDSTS